MPIPIAIPDKDIILSVFPVTDNIKTAESNETGIIDAKIRAVVLHRKTAQMIINVIQAPMRADNKTDLRDSITVVDESDMI
jgi:hypothetical protein